MKKILGLDLGTTSIGWAYVNEAENNTERSSIIKLGARVIPYGDNLVKVDKSGKVSASMTPEADFASGKGLSPNAGRTQKRGARRNLQRYKLRRDNLIEILIENNFINNDSLLSENGNHSTFKTYENRSKAATQKIELEDFAKTLLMINKKRGYKSSRKAKNQDEGQLIDGMEVAKNLYENNLTPGAFVYNLLINEKKHIPDFYRSDLQSEFDKIWDFQKQFYPEIFNEKNKEKLIGLKKKASTDYFEKILKITTPELKGDRIDKRLKKYEYRNKAITEKLEIGEIAEALIEINGDLASSSGYLGAISDRSKELYFNKLTVGQNLYSQIKIDPHARLKSQVFYRKDYLDEFETIWTEQAKHYSLLTNELKAEIRDIIIFYQRRLKSQKGLVSYCEFENKQIEITDETGKKKLKTIGSKVCPKSSPLFQEFKIWQILNNIEVTHKKEEKRFLELEEKQTLFEVLNLTTNLKKSDALKLLFKKPSEFDINYKDIEGNRTNAALYDIFIKIVEHSGHDKIDFSKLTGLEKKETLFPILKSLGIKTEILSFNSSLEGNDFEKQISFQLWHLLYSYEDDNSATGNEKLLILLEEKFGFKKEFAMLLSNVVFQPDYGSLSTKAIRKILPHLQAGFSYGGNKENPEEPSACEYAGYNHSKSLNKEERANRILKEKLEILPKNSLRNPIVEKILNQMINVINSACEEFGKPDEIRIELARELKKSAKEREEMTTNISKAKDDHERFKKTLQTEFGLSYVSRNDIIRYKLYKELEYRGFKTIYTNTYIPAEKLFSKEFDIEHIIPKAKLYDDSFSNKTLECRSANIDKADETAYDFVKNKYGEGNIDEYTKTVEDLFNKNIISKAKKLKLLMKGTEIPDGFIERDLRDSQYIAKKAKSMLEEVFRVVTTTTGMVTDKLREDWQLIDVMQELNWEKYKAIGLTYFETNKEGKQLPRIKGWTKRNDHRHHAMDALTVAFTKHNHNQFLNYQNARKDEGHKWHPVVSLIEKKETYRDNNGKLRFNPPIPLNDFRAEAKKQLENVLISFKAKSKVVTINKNKAKGADKSQITLTPRGQLHQETVYGKIKQYQTTVVKIGGNMDFATINKVSSKKHREALLKRLAEFENDPKKAFTGKNSLVKNPVFLNDLQTFKVPEKVKLVTFEDVYTIRKDITPDLNVEKIIDTKIRELLQERLKSFNNDSKKAFSNLEENPIWLNEEKGVRIKRVTVSGISNAVSLHSKKDKDGNLILDDNGNEIAVDFVNTGNNHHVAVYRDEKGNLQENVISFYEAVERLNQGLSIIDKTFKEEEGWQFLFSMKQNEYFVFPNEITGFNPQEIDLLNSVNYNLISPNLFRVQKFGSLLSGFWFRHHLQTQIDTSKELKGITYKVIQSTKNLENIIKVRINHLGKIIEVGESKITYPAQTVKQTLAGEKRIILSFPLDIAERFNQVYNAFSEEDKKTINIEFIKSFDKAPLSAGLRKDIEDFIRNNVKFLVKQEIV